VRYLRHLWESDLSKTLIALFLVCAGIGIARPRTFLTFNNFINVLSQTSVNGALAVGMSFILLTGGIDLSVGSVAAFSSLITAMLLVDGHNIFVALMAGFAVAVSIGAFSGLLVDKLSLPPFIVTLSTMTIFRGTTIVVSQGKPVTQLGDAFSYIGVKYIGFIPISILIMGGMFLVSYYALHHTRFGRYVYAMGGNKEAARLSGINTTAITISVYVICAFCASIAGMIMASRVNSATPTTADGAEMDAIAAAVIGGVSLSGGKGKIMGSLIGVLLIGVLNNGLVLLDIDVFWTKVVKGLIILFAVIVDTLSKSADKFSSAKELRSSSK
jgi:ribose transport system permease protein